MSEDKSLVKKLCEIGESLIWMQKRGVMKSDKFTYKYATEADLVLAIRMEMFKRHVFLTPSAAQHTRETIRSSYKDGGEKVSYMADVMIEWTWHDGDSGETLKCQMPGCGADSGDKCTYKAITGSEKYLLLKTFLIPTFDDAEAMGPADKKALQKRVGIEKTAEMRAAKDMRDAQSPEEEEKISRKAKVVFISMPERFNGEYAAVYGTGIQSEHMIQFLQDCNGARFKGPEGVLWKLEAQYINDCKAFVQKQGFTLEAKE